MSNLTAQQHYEHNRSEHGKREHHENYGSALKGIKNKAKSKALEGMKKGVRNGNKPHSLLKGFNNYE